MRNIILTIVILSQWIALSAFGQWECPSQLGGSLKPLGDSKLMWGTELTLAAGSLANNSIYNTMGLLGLDYTSNAHTLYFEGGFKYWYRKDGDLNANFSQLRFGLREAYYQHKSHWGKLNLGLQSMRSDDEYLLNERVLGLHYTLETGPFAVTLFGGTVSKDFARNGTFCSVSYLYDILPYRYRTLLGSTLGQTDMAGFTLSYHPSTGHSSNSTLSDDGLGAASDELSTTAPQSPSFIHVETVGGIFYSEFGSWITTPRFWPGIYSQISVGNEYWVKPEVLYQAASGNRAVIYTLRLEKAFTWANTHRTSMEVRYLGLTAIDKGASAANLFSNVYSGTVLRLDSPDMPFYQIGIKHTIPNLKAHVKLQATSQTSSSSMREFDAEIGKKFWGKLLINGTYGYAISPLLSSNPNLLRIEMRLDL